MFGVIITRRRPPALPCQRSANPPPGEAGPRAALRRSGYSSLAIASTSTSKVITPMKLRTPSDSDEGGEDVGLLLHLQRGGHPALQELRVGERADREALLAARDRGHREVLAGHAAEPHVLGTPAEEGVADVVVGADEAGQHDLAAAVDDAPGAGRVRRLDPGARTHRGDASVLDVDRAVLDHAVRGVHRQHGGVPDEQAHGVFPAVVAGAKRTPAPRADASDSGGPPGSGPDRGLVGNAGYHARTPAAHGDRDMFELLRSSTLRQLLARQAPALALLAHRRRAVLQVRQLHAGMPRLSRHVVVLDAMFAQIGRALSKPAEGKT